VGDDHRQRRKPDGGGTSKQRSVKPLTELYQNKTARGVDGIVEMYGNKWEFRFKPENVTVAEFKVEDLQANIRYISEKLGLLAGWPGIRFGESD